MFDFVVLNILIYNITSSLFIRNQYNQIKLTTYYLLICKKYIINILILIIIYSNYNVYNYN